jgi:hypothetical protein
MPTTKELVIEWVENSEGNELWIAELIVAFLEKS